VLGDRHLRDRDHEEGRQGAPRPGRQGGDEDVESAQAAPEQLTRERLDANADEGRERAAGHPVGDGFGGADGIAVLLGIGAVAVAVLEVDAVVFHRLALQLGEHAGVDAIGQGLGHAEGVRERVGVGRVLAHGPQGQGPELAGRVGLEELRAAVHRVDGLTGGRVAGMPTRERGVGLAQAPERGFQHSRREGRLDPGRRFCR
jgi:hypothetical protein